MGLNIILTGANGRMGRVAHDLLEQDKDFSLSGLVVLPAEQEEARSRTHVPVFNILEEALVRIPSPVIIDFTAPEASLDFARIAARHKAAQVIGTTGLNQEQREELALLARQTPLLWSPNMSVGITVLLKVLPELVRMLGPGYDLEVMEIHHKKKKDAPSGTALRLGECLAAAGGRSLDQCACCHREGIAGERPQGEIGLQSIRGGDVAGVHTVYFLGQGERIELTHQAHSRENFAQGALRAAKWLAGQKPGRLYGIQDTL